MNIVHIVPSIDEEASGPSYSVVRLSTSLVRDDTNVELHALGANNVRQHNGCSIITHPRWSYPGRLGVSPTMRRSLAATAQHTDIMHNHSLWMMPNVYPAQAIRNTNCRLVVSPRGTLSERALQRSFWTKRAMWRLWQHEAIRQAACLHATAEHEYEDIRKAGFRQPVAIIPNGIDVPPFPGHAAGARRTLLFLGRIHPIKGLEVLLQSWRILQDSVPDWELQIVGPGDAKYLASLQRLASELQVQRVTFAGPAYGDEKKEWYRRADLFVLPSWSENFGVAVSESLANGVPAIVTNTAPWSGLSRQRCGWWIETGEAPLTTCLQSALQIDRATLNEMGQRGRQWMQEEFTWSRVGSMMHGTYEWLLGGGPPPDWIATD